MVANQTNNENNWPIPPSYLTQPRVRGIKVGAQTSPSHFHFSWVLLSFLCISHTLTSSDIDLRVARAGLSENQGQRQGRARLCLWLLLFCLLLLMYGDGVGHVNNKFDCTFFPANFMLDYCMPWSSCVHACSCLCIHFSTSPPIESSIA